MYNDHLLEYFRNHPQKKLFFINDLIIDLKLPEPILSKQLLKLTTNYPAIGTYNRNTGWFLRSDLYYPLKKKKLHWFSKEFYILSSLFILSILTNWLLLTFFITLLAMGLVMNEVFDNMSYLKEYKL